jgi:LysM repeat protein
VKVRSTHPPTKVDDKQTTVAHLLPPMPGALGAGATPDDPFLQDAFLHDRADVSSAPEPLEDEKLGEDVVGLDEDAYLDEELLAAEALYEPVPLAETEEDAESPRKTPARTARPRRRIPLAGQSPATIWACVLGLLVAGIAVLPHVQAIQVPWTQIATSASALPLKGIAVAKAQAKGSSGQSGCAWHTVVPGDTLWGLSIQYGVGVDTLARVNQIANPSLILAGQVLCIPSGDGAVQTDAAPQPIVQGEPAFVKFVLPYARRAHDDTGWPLSVILAQWGLEQGWQTPRFTGYNWGNCGAVPDEPTVPGTSAPGSPPAFAYAPGPEDGLRIYLHVAHLGYYTEVAPTAQQGGADAAARALGRSPWDAGHYTDHGDPGSSLLAVMRDFNLYQYD